MRLLNVTNWMLEYFMTSSMPSYAILSHMWSSEEVTFQDLQEQRFLEKSGSRKIQLACRQAMMDGIQYIWIDTCCIDKTSSSELSEAINSMFAWYRDAAICYVFLEDVTALYEAPDNDLEGSYGPEAAFERTRWFTRGWTVQELIAPPECEFFDRHWAHISSRSAAASAIARITGIPIQNLSRRGLNDFSIAQRLSWAADRVTTRIEDQAYSLLGLFGVTMPLLYGEERRAFTRLQREILQGSADLSILAWSGDSDVNLSPLAQSLSNFSECSSVIRTKKQDGSSWANEAAMTNVGLRIHGRIVVSDSEASSGPTRSFCLVLNCHYEGDITRAIALKLTLVSGNLDESIAETMKAGVLECVVGWLGESPSDRLVMLDVLELESKAIEATVMIRHGLLQDITNPAGLIDRKRGWSHLWLRFDGTKESNLWDIIHVFPKHHWNHQSRTFNLAKARADQVEREDRMPIASRKLTFGLPLFGAVALENRKGHRFAVYFCFRSPSLADGMAIELAAYDESDFRRPHQRLLERVTVPKQSIIQPDESRISVSLRAEMISEHVVALISVSVSQRALEERSQTSTGSKERLSSRMQIGISRRSHESSST